MMMLTLNILQFAEQTISGHKARPLAVLAVIAIVGLVFAGSAAACPGLDC